MKLKFAKLNPNGNITIIVTEAIDRSQQSAIAEELMAYEGVFAEQVGFLEAGGLPNARARLQMMGGEFCGNASMSMAAWLAYCEDAPMNETRSYPLEVSGAEGLLDCRIRRIGESRFQGEVPMPLPEAILETEILSGCAVPLVRFPGIAHAILPENAMDDAQAEAMISQCCAALKAKAMGFLFTNANFSRIRPLVYVADTDTAVWENGCGSGTAALGAYAAMRAEGAVQMEIAQPGGKIGVSAQWEGGRVRRIEIGGSVSIVAVGEAFLNGTK